MIDRPEETELKEMEENGRKWINEWNGRKEWKWSAVLSDGSDNNEQEDLWFQ